MENIKSLADSFTAARINAEQVLNNDSKNARAYLGKFLANQRCGSIMAYRGKSLLTVSLAASAAVMLTEWALALFA